jgi:hypothetical protein
MSRPTLEVADILRVAGSNFLQRHGSHLAPQHRKVMDAIVRCRTAALGGHRDRCSGCGHQAISYNSCRNRHCPKCQSNARDRWLAARSGELLPVPYFHLVFTLPHELSALVLQNKKLLYDLLFRTSAATLLEVARDPKHLGADIGLLSVLHTWGQNLQHHPHVHCVVPGGGLALDGSTWVAASRKFFLPVRVLSRVFRGKFAAELKQLLLQGKLQFHGKLQELASPERFLIHVLPKGLVRIRHFGLFANRKRSASLLRCRMLLNAAAPPPQPASTAQIKCPLCSELMLVIERFTSLQLLSAPPSTAPIKPRLDSS